MMGGENDMLTSVLEKAPKSRARERPTWPGAWGGVYRKSPQQTTGTRPRVGATSNGSSSKRSAKNGIGIKASTGNEPFNRGCPWRSLWQKTTRPGSR